jgi:hypothetical protein
MRSAARRTFLGVDASGARTGRDDLRRTKVCGSLSKVDRKKRVSLYAFKMFANSER